MPESGRRARDNANTSSNHSSRNVQTKECYMNTTQGLSASGLEREDSEVRDGWEERERNISETECCRTTRAPGGKKREIEEKGALLRTWI